MISLSKTQEKILKFIDFWGRTSKESLLKSGFTKYDLMGLREAGYIEIDFRPPVSYLGEWVVSLEQKGIDYLSKLLKGQKGVL